MLGSQLQTEVALSDEPSHLSPDPMYLKVSEQVTGQSARYIRAAGGSDARFICRRGIPVMVSRPLVGELHSVKEWIDVASMGVHYRILERYLQRKLATD